MLGDAELTSCHPDDIEGVGELPIRMLDCAAGHIGPLLLSVSMHTSSVYVSTILEAGSGRTYSREVGSHPDISGRILRTTLALRISSRGRRTHIRLDVHLAGHPQHYRYIPVQCRFDCVCDVRGWDRCQMLPHTLSKGRAGGFSSGDCSGCGQLAAIRYTFISL